MSIESCNCCGKRGDVDFDEIIYDKEDKPWRDTCVEELSEEEQEERFEL